MGIFYVKVLAHEIGHSLGVSHDGDSDFSQCSHYDNYIMTPLIGFYAKNPQNQFRFSKCSINAFKRILLTTDKKFDYNFDKN